MAVVKCEYCGFEQDPAVSVICDRCGRRLGRIRLDFPAEAAPINKEEGESRRCPSCGVSTTKNICPSCGAVVRERAV
jgi:DNA-directed RNA polymerase subunit RPC12/RpoP